MRIYFDRCIVIYRIGKARPWSTLVQAALSANALEEFCTSDLVRLECRTGAKRQSNLSLLADYDLFFTSTSILPIDTTIYDLATDLRARHGLKTPDAIHLATALHHRCEQFWTNDLRLAKATSGLRFRTF